MASLYMYELENFLLYRFRFGRKKMIIVYTTICAIFGVASAFSVDIVMYTVLRCVIALPMTGLWDCTSAHRKFADLCQCTMKDSAPLKTTI